MRRGIYVVTCKVGGRRRERHPDPKKIEDFAAGLVSPARAKKLQRHVDGCLPCHGNVQRALLNLELSEENANRNAAP